MSGVKTEVVIRTFLNGTWDGKESVEKRMVYAHADGSHWINWMGGKARVAPEGDRYVFNWQIQDIKAHSFREIFGK